jgi:hypothetical protein
MAEAKHLGSQAGLHGALGHVSQDWVIFPHLSDKKAVLGSFPHSRRVYQVDSPLQALGQKLLEARFWH